MSKMKTRVDAPDGASVFLREIEGPEAELDFFELHPQLSEIWKEPLLSMAREGFVEMGRCEGGRFAIEETGRVVGVTGFYAVREEPSILRLRWHGLIPEARGRGLSGSAMRAAAELGRSRFPQAELLVESMPSGAKGALIASHFEALGFSPRGRPQPGGAAGFDWQEWAADLSVLLRASPNSGARRAAKP